MHIVKTQDGSTTIYLPYLNEHYHSTHGAIQESLHVYIQHGLLYFRKKKLAVFEMGFGTGLNALLALHEAVHKDISINYLTVEKYPINKQTVENLDFGAAFQSDLKNIHALAWNQPHQIHPNFEFQKQQIDIRQVKLEPESVDVIFFDAFAPDKQPDLWSESVFLAMYNALIEGGILVSYSVKGTVKQVLRKVGFSVEKLPGPPGKFHMLRATK